MKKKFICALCTLCIFSSGYLLSYLNFNTDKTLSSYANTGISQSNEYTLYQEFMSEIKKETTSLTSENEYLKQQISNLKYQLNEKVEETDAKFYGYTIYFTLNKRYSSVFRTNEWNNGSKFAVNGTTYSEGIGFDRKDNGDRSYYVAKLYNFNAQYANLTGYLGVDDLAKDLSDSEITFTVFNNDEVIKCNNEFYGDVLYKTTFKKSDGLKKIDVNLKGAQNIIIEFSVSQNSDLNYFLLLDPKLQ